MKPIRSLLTTALALTACAVTLRADLLPPVQDTSSAKAKLTAGGGKASTLAVNATSKAFVLFNLESLPVGVLPADIANARLRVYFPKVTMAGDISITTATQAWAETAAGAEPTVAGAPIAIFPSAMVVTKKFIEVDVTATVRAWRTTPADNFGFAFTADGITKVTLGAKEGAGTGYPAELEVQIDRATVDGSIGTAQLGSNLTLGGTTIGTFSGSLAGNAATATSATTAGSATTATTAGNVTGIVAIANGGTGSATKSFVDLSTAQDIGGTKNFTGNVGIGTTTPGMLLEVSGGGNGAAVQFTNATDNLGFHLKNTGVGGVDWMLASTAGTSGVGQGKLQFYADGFGGPTVTIQPNGNVGIGKTNPATALDVNGTVTATAYSGPGAWSANGGDVFRSGGNVGIGTGTPGMLLEVSGGGNGGTAQLTSAQDQVSLHLKNTGAGGVDWSIQSTGGTSGSGQGKLIFATGFGSGSAFPFTVQSNGNVGIGTTTPSFKLDVNGGIRCIGAVDTSSDARFKTDVRPVTGALGTIGALRGVSYDWNRADFPGKDFPKRRSLGFIAQEVEKVLPEVVTRDADGYYSVAYSEVIPVLVEATKELRAENATLRQKLAALEARDAAREARLSRLEESLDPRAARTVRASLDLK